MILPSPKRSQRNEDSILPLINIVFLLLIFFMLAGSVQTYLPFTLTPPETGHADHEDVKPNLLSIAADGRMALGSTPIQVSELSTRLGNRDPAQALQVEADAALPVTDLTKILADLRAIGVAQVRLITLHNP